MHVDVPTRPSSANVENAAEDPGTRNQRITTLNRELWDVRRQITALKAREDTIMNELKSMRAPELVESTVVPQQKAPVAYEERIKQLETEVNSTCACGGRAAVAATQRSGLRWLRRRDRSARRGSLLQTRVLTVLGVVALRMRLQSETVRRQLVEESCENERRRRKHAEDLLDDARRESGAPLVVPAMMNAFERIAQLTGEALMASSPPPEQSQQPPAPTW